MAKFVESAKGTRLGGKYTQAQVKKRMHSITKIQKEYEEVSIQTEDAWNAYMGHICFKCFCPGIKCSKREELRNIYAAFQAKQLRMELFAHVS
jgi:hypothetical protein